jgi:hypothetical protein
MNKYIIIIILLLINIFIYYKNKNKVHIEKYDGKITGIESINRCAAICSSVLGASGFAYDPTTSNCYISKYPITSPPMPAPYSSEYKPKNIYCNKFRPILSDQNLNSSSYVENRVYNCYTQDAQDGGLKYITESSTEEITNDKINLIKSDPYDLQTYDFGINLRGPITDIKIDSDNNIQYSLNNIGFDEKLDEYLGQYMNPAVCKTNMDKKSCLKNCAENSNCVGTEYNTSYTDKNNNTYINLCCPKSRITKQIPRRPIYQNGKFYNKKIVDITVPNFSDVTINP